MADLFLSYAREDRECAELLARALMSRGWTAWWDRRIQVGRSFSAEIERELDAAGCVLVLWSRHSLESEWVQNEAAEAARRKVLVPVRIEDVRPPLEFRRLQSADLFDWRNGFAGPEFEACLASIEALARRNTATHAAPPQPQQPPPDHWIHQDGKQFHAPDLETLHRWAEEGRVKPDSQIYDAARKRWIPARDAAELRGAFHKEPEPPPAEFWVNQDGRQFAVGDIAALRELAEQGKIDGDTGIYDPEARRWVKARKVRALDGAFPVKPPSPPSAPAMPKPEPAQKSASLLTRVFAIACIGLVVLVIVIASMTRREEPTTDTAVTDTSVMQLLSTDTAITDTVATDTAVTDTAVADTAVTDTAVTDTAVADTAVTSTAAASRTISISVKNTCTNETISTAVAYVDSTGTWVSHGWYVITPGETKVDIARATDGNVYFYGMAGQSEWKGNASDSLKHPIPVNKSAAFGGPIQQLSGDGFETVSFFGRTVPADRTTWTQNFNCE